MKPGVRESSYRATIVSWKGQRAFVSSMFQMAFVDTWSADWVSFATFAWRFY